MPHECPSWRLKKAENIIRICILLCQPRLSFFSINFWPSDKFPERSKWDSSQQQNLCEQLKAYRLGRTSNNKQTTQRRLQLLQLLGTNDKTGNGSFESSAVLLKMHWISDTAETKKKILISFVFCIPAYLHFKTVPLAFNSFSSFSFPFSFSIFSV